MTHSDAASHLALLDAPPNEQAVIDFMVSELQAQVLQLAAKRTFQRSQIRLAVSMTKAALKACASEIALKAEIQLAAKSECQKASAIDAIAVVAALDEELTAIRTAISGRDVDEMLRIIPGKELFQKLSRLAGARGSQELSRSIYNKLNHANYPHLISLREELAKRFA